MDKSFLPENFLLSTPTSEKLYFEFAQSQPLFDYHCHIPPAEIAQNRQFENLTRIWLADGHFGDHYKWRAMRANGVPERFITGDASDYEKFLAYARTVPATLRNPLYHWTHLELRRYFGITELLNEESAPRIWAQANEQLQELTVHRILEKFRVSVVCTTDDPTDDLASHQAIRKSGLPTRVYPAFRPDKVFAIDQIEAFRLGSNVWRRLANGVAQNFRACSTLCAHGTPSLDHSGQNCRITVYPIPIRSPAKKARRARSMHMPAPAL